jgi:hypothetical protein
MLQLHAGLCIAIACVNYTYTEMAFTRPRAHKNCGLATTAIRNHTLCELKTLQTTALVSTFSFLILLSFDVGMSRIH